MYDSHIVPMTHAIIYMHHQYQYEMYTRTREAVNKRSDSTTPSCYLSRDWEDSLGSYIIVHQSDTSAVIAISYFWGSRSLIIFPS